MSDDDSRCSHLESALHRKHGVHPNARGCSDCLATGDVWVHLRLCLTCGHVGCCDESPNRHARQHAHATHHPVVRSYEPDEPWAYCFPDDAFVEELPAFEGEFTTRHFDPPSPMR